MDEIKAKKVRTINIEKAIQKYAQENLIPESGCDFTISKIEYQIKDVQNVDFLAIDSSTLQKYADKDKIINEHIQFKQIFTVVIKKESEHKIKLNYSIEYGHYSTHPKITINPNSEIPYKSMNPKELYSLLVKELNKIKARNSILINLLDAPMTKTLKMFVKHIYAGKFTKKVRIPLFDGIEPELTRRSMLILWFQENNKHTQYVEVEKGETVVEWKKPIFGHTGFDCFGHRIDSNYSENSQDLDVYIDKDSIEVIEHKTKKLYKSKKKGFVKYDKSGLSINNKINIRSLTRNNESVSSQEHNSIEVLISQHDTTKDSLGEGAKITSETVHINGHTGANSVIEAVHLQIDGATHKESTQFAKTAIINRHKGTLRCSDAKITLLEGGEVHATTVDVASSLGGSIYAQDVTIGQVKNNLKVYASHSITVKLVSGEDNLFKINYRDIPILNSKTELINNELEALNEDLEEASKNDASLIPAIENKIDKLKAELYEIKTSAQRAKITLENPLKGLNTIIFTIDDKNEIVYKTDPRAYKPFYLVIDEDKVTLHPTNKTIILK
jgi:hypothetical protein